MHKRSYIRALGACFVVVGIAFAIIFAQPVKMNPNPGVWLSPDYYSQFLPIAVSFMLLICGTFLALEHAKANFNLAVFGHTAFEEVFFSSIGLTQSALSGWTKWVFLILSLVTLWIAYSNLLKQKPLSLGEALFGIIFGAVLVLLPTIL